MAEGSPTGAATTPVAGSVPDEELIRDLVCGMLSQDPRQLRTTVARYYSPGAVLYHYFTRAASALDMYRVYRAYSFGFRSRPVIRDIIIDSRLRKPHCTTQHMHEHGTSAGVRVGSGVHGGEAAPPEGSSSVAVWLDQHVVPKGWPLPLPEAIIPTIVLLKFRPCPETGTPLVYEQFDHVSLYGFVWSFGTPTLWLFEHVFTPALMYGIGAVTYGLDFMEESWRFVKQQVLNMQEIAGESSCGRCAAGAGGGRGAACGEPQRRVGSGAAGAGLRTSAMELPGEINHTATGYGLAGKQLDGSDLLPTPAALNSAVSGKPAPAPATATSTSKASARPLPPLPLR